MLQLFRHHVSVGSVMQLIAEGGLAFGAVLLAVYVQQAPYGVSPSSAAVPAVAFAGLLLLVNAAFGLYRWDRARNFAAVIGRMMVAVAVAVPLVYVGWNLVPNGGIAQDAVWYTVLYALSGLILLRQAFYSVRSVGVGARRVLVVGAGAEARGVEADLKALGAPLYQVVGFYPAGRPDDVQVPADRVFPSGMALRDIVRRFKVREVIVAVRDQRGGVLPLSELLECRVSGIPVTDLAGLYERVRGEFPIDSLKASWLIYGHGFSQDKARAFVKRVTDILVSTVLLTLATPVIIATAIAVRLESRGPIIYRQERVGRGGRPFMCLKFRSMRSDAEKDGVARWAQAKDPRVTAVGSFIRKVRIDELPQLINVLRGEMSLVGPRPERPAFVDQLKKDVPFYDLRHSVKPGLTGWAQVRYSYAASLEDARKKLQYDLYYVKNHSLFLDILIILETVRVVLFREGAH
jgi:sugar transferase (PEP-CTERM system associated)